jgi:hypothetical protein
VVNLMAWLIGLEAEPRLALVVLMQNDRLAK